MSESDLVETVDEIGFHCRGITYTQWRS